MAVMSEYNSQLMLAIVSMRSNEMKKSFNFITRRYIINKTLVSKKLLIDIGIVSLFVALALELVIGQKFGVIFIIPLLYLVKSRNQFSSNKMFCDVPVLLVIDEEYLSIQYQNVYYDKKKTLSLKYIIYFKDVSDIFFYEKRSSIFIHYKGKMQMIDETGNVHSAKNNKKEILEIYIPPNIQKEIINAFNCSVKAVSIK